VLSVVIPTYNRAARLRLTLTCLFSLVSEEAPETEIIVVNDGGAEDIRSIAHHVAKPFPGQRVKVFEIAHLGRSAGRNFGARQATGKRILFLDDDVLVTPGLLKCHLRYVKGNKRALVRGGILYLPWLSAFDDPAIGTLTPKAQRSLTSKGQPSPKGLLSRRVQLNERGFLHESVASLARMSKFERDLHAWLKSDLAEFEGRWIASTGAHLSIDQESFNALCGFDEEMGLRWGAEDLEFGYRAQEAHIPILYAEDAIVYHMDTDASGREIDHKYALSYFARKHNDPKVLRLISYFAHECPLAEVFAA